MKLTKFALAALLGASLCYPASAGDWITLFDGETLNGWSQRNGYATYRVVDGTILGRTSTGSPNSFLCTTTNFGDFELEFEVKVDDELNSGVMIRSSQKPESSGSGRNERAGRVYGPQVEIESSGQDGAESGYVYGEATGRGWLTPQDRLIPHKTMRDGEWNSYRIVAKGVQEVREARPDMGVLAITHFRRLLDHLMPDRVHILMNGKLAASGGFELAAQLDAEGYEAWR